MVGSKREKGKKTEIYRGKDSKRRRTNERGGIETRDENWGRERERESTREVMYSRKVVQNFGSGGYGSVGDG